jgi:hypothetical protein
MALVWDALSGDFNAEGAEFGKREHGELVSADALRRRERRGELVAVRK